MQSTLKIVVAMVIWGSLGIFVRHINLPSMEIAFLRALIASCVLGIAGIWIKGENRLSNIKANIKHLVISGIALGLNWVLLFQAYKFTTISNSTLSYYFAPVFVILLSPFILREKFTKSKLISVLGSMAGLFLILYSHPASQNTEFNHVKGILFGLMAAVLYAAVVITNKRMKDIQGFDRTLVQMSVSTLVLLPFIISRNAMGAISPGSFPFIITLGVVHTGIAYLLYFSSIKELKAQNVAVLSYIDPISAIILGTLFLSEPITLMQAAGGLLILGSTFLGERVK